MGFKRTYCHCQNLILRGREEKKLRKKNLLLYTSSEFSQELSASGELAHMEQKFWLLCQETNRTKG